MGGGNGLKSHMSQQKKAAKAEAEKSGGGGSAGKAARSELKDSIHCARCKTPFPSAKRILSLKEHHEHKHPTLPFSECFPGIEA